MKRNEFESIGPAAEWIAHGTAGLLSGRERAALDAWLAADARSAAALRSSMSSGGR